LANFSKERIEYIGEYSVRMYYYLLVLDSNAKVINAFEVLDYDISIDYTYLMEYNRLEKINSMSTKLKYIKFYLLVLGIKAKPYSADIERLINNK